jgi:hypothetical protein
MAPSWPRTSRSGGPITIGGVAKKGLPARRAAASLPLRTGRGGYTAASGAAISRDNVAAARQNA